MKRLEGMLETCEASIGTPARTASAIRLTNMPPIPESKLRACLAVLHAACMRARLLGYQGQAGGLSVERAELIADLMDAVHHLPDFIQRWAACDERRLRGMLEAFDRKWPHSGVALLATYDAAAAEHS